MVALYVSTCHTTLLLQSSAVYNKTAFERIAIRIARIPDVIGERGRCIVLLFSGLSFYLLRRKNVVRLLRMM